MKVAVSREFEARLRHAASGKLSLSTQAAKGEGWAPPFISCAPRYSGTLTPTAPTANRLRETFFLDIFLVLKAKGLFWYMNLNGHLGTCRVKST